MFRWKQCYTRSFLISLLLCFIISAVPADAATVIRPVPIKGDKVITHDTHIVLIAPFPGTSPFGSGIQSAIYAGPGKSVTADPGVVTSIWMKYPLPFGKMYGILAHGNGSSGAEVSLGEVHIKVGYDGPLSGLLGPRESGGIYAKYGGVVNIGANSTIDTYGTRESMGLKAEYANSSINVGANTSITTRGDHNSDGVNASYGGKVNIGSGSRVTTEGNNSGGLVAQTSRILELPFFADSVIRTSDDVTVETFGKLSHGVYAGSGLTPYSASVFLGKDNKITTHGNSSYGLFANHGNSLISADSGLEVSTHGKINATAVFARLGGEINIGDNAKISTEGHISYGLAAKYNDSKITAGDGLSVSTDGYGSHAVYAKRGGEVTIGDNAEISTEGRRAHGLVAKREGAKITAGDGLSVSTDGNRSHAVYALSSSDITIGDNAEISTDGYKSYGLAAKNKDSHITVGDGMSVETAGYGSHAVYAKRGGEVTIGDNAEISTEGRRAHGLVAKRKGAKITAGDGLSVSTDGNRSHAVYALRSSDITIGDNAEISTEGYKSYGLAAKNKDSHITVGDGMSVETAGYGSHAVYALRSSDITIGGNADISTEGRRAHGLVARRRGAKITAGDGLSVSTDGNRSHAVYALRSSDITIGDNAEISTEGYKSYGLAAKYKDSHITVGDGMSIDTTGHRSHAVYAKWRGDITIGDSAEISTDGYRAYGLAAKYKDAKITAGDGLSVNTAWHNSHAVFAKRGGDITIGGNASLTTEGDRAFGMVAMGKNANISIGAGSSINTSGRYSHAVFAKEGGSISMDGATINVGERDTAYAIYARSLAGKSSNIEGDGVFDITGDIKTTATLLSRGASVDLTLQDGSTFSGATRMYRQSKETINLTMNGSNTTWNVARDSTLTNLKMNGSTVNYESSPMFSTITAQYLDPSGTGGTYDGTFTMRADIPAISSDKLIVTDRATGNYRMIVRNVGTAAATGAEVVTMAETAVGSTAVFTMTDPVECGAWQYMLGNTTRSGGGDHLWQLRGTRKSSRAGSAAINSFAGSYLMAYAETMTLLQRMGDLRGTAYEQGLWFRVHGGKFESDVKSYVRGFDMDYGGVQIGYDRIIDNNENGRFYAGVMFGYSKGDLDYDRAGDGEVDSKTFGVYGTYIGSTGFYVDAVLKYQWMDDEFNIHDSQGTHVVGGDVSTGGIGASVEVGQRFHVGEGSENKMGWYVEPQAQFSYQHQDGGTFNASNGLKIGVDSFSSLLGRLGIVIGYETEKTNFYGKVSKVKEFDGDLTVRANGLAFGESFDDDWWVYGIGFTSRVNDRNSLYLDLERSSGGGFSQPWRVTAGWRVEF